VDLTPLVPQGRQIIESYGDGRFRVTGAVHQGSILVFPDKTVAWPVGAIAGLTEESLSGIAARVMPARSSFC